MDKLLTIASYLYKKYKYDNKIPMDEMKMHKILYFLQRESYIENHNFLFENDFYGWKYGPILKEIRRYYSDNLFEDVENNQLSEQDRKLIDCVYEKYSKKDSWSLSILTHGEYSWKQSRIGIAEYENSDVIIKKEDIIVDAQRIITRRNFRKHLGICK